MEVVKIHAQLEADQVPTRSHECYRMFVTVAFLQQGMEGKILTKQTFLPLVQCYLNASIYHVFVQILFQICAR